MASRCVKDLRYAADGLERDGWPVSAAVCRQAADRMERMEDEIARLHKPLASEDDEA